VKGRDTGGGEVHQKDNAGKSVPGEKKERKSKE